jgi:hypothetical protein
MILHDLETRLLASAELRKEFYFDWQISGREGAILWAGPLICKTDRYQNKKRGEHIPNSPRSWRPLI